VNLYSIFLVNDGAKMYRMRSVVPAFKQAPALPGMPFEGPVPVRAAKTRQIGHVRQLPDRGRFVERPLERRTYPAQGGLSHALGAQSPALRKGTVCLRTHTRDGADSRPLPAANGVGPSPQRGTRRQPAREPGTEGRRPQPTGIRVSDAIAWAQEILARYTGVSDTSNNAQDRS